MTPKSDWINIKITCASKKIRQLVVDKMPQKRLDWAMVQVQNSLVRLAKERRRNENL